MPRDAAGRRTLWFTRGLSNTYDALTLIRQADLDRRWRLLASHTDPQALALQAADVALLEPVGALSGGVYTQWLLDTALAHDVDVLVVQRRQTLVAQRRALLEAAGIEVMVAGDAGTLRTLANKDQFYAQAQAAGLPVPPCRVVRTVAEFDAAVDALTPLSPVLCVKPARGIYGAGFRVLAEGVPLLDPQELLAEPALLLAPSQFRAALQTTPAHDAPWLVMAYLDGVERSVDVLAHHGCLVRAVSREKQGAVQVLEVDGPSVDLAARTVEQFGLHGLVNVQTRDWQGQPWLLEVNSRMAGGIAYGALTGLNLPWWAAQLALGEVTPDQVPTGQGGVRAALVPQAVALRPVALSPVAPLVAGGVAA